MEDANMPQQRMPETADELAAAVFSECLITLVRSAAMLLGKVTVPATGEPVKDLTRVQLIIKQLELLEKNASQLSIDEQQLVKQSLQELRMAYVSAAGKRPEDADEPDVEDEQEKPASTQSEQNKAENEKAPDPSSKTDATDEDEEDTNRKRFVKKYD
ncbi:MAG TPA: hypothetical protein DEB48_13105 [Verrucomicrobiales bacterium]|nr:hypothetical protein [Verrucomicrobiales bacterium]|tara:strand:+ start:7272 stop:7745 length:474 start_codon:yes stop_codon:yes gene_type:complete